MSPFAPASNTQEWLNSSLGPSPSLGSCRECLRRLRILRNDNLNLGSTLCSAKNDAHYYKRDYERYMRECAEACLALCIHVDAMNDLVVYSISSAYALQSLYEADASKTDRTAPIRQCAPNSTRYAQVNSYGDGTAVWPGM